MDYIEEARSLIKTEKEYLIKELEKFSFKVFDSKANFILFKTKLPIYELLLNKGILIRDCSNYKGLEKGYYRIAVRLHEDNEILIKTIGECING